MLNPTDGETIDERLLPHLVNGSDVLTPVLHSIATGLGVSESELGMLLPLLSDQNLTFANLSQLYAATLLIDIYKLEVADFVALIELSNVPISTSPAQMLVFLKQLETFATNALSAKQAQWLLTHAGADANEGSALSQYFLSDESVSGFLTALDNAYVEINHQFASQYNPNLAATEQLGVLAEGLPVLFEPTDAAVIIDIVNRNWQAVAPNASAVDVKNFIAQAFVDGITNESSDNSHLIGEINNAIDALGAIDVNGDFSAPQGALVSSLFDLIAKVKINGAKQALLVQNLASAFSREPELIAIVLEHAKLKQQNSDSIMTEQPQALSKLLMIDFDAEITPLNTHLNMAH